MYSNRVRHLLLKMRCKNGSISDEWHHFASSVLASIFHYFHLMHPAYILRPR